MATENSIQRFIEIPLEEVQTSKAKSSRSSSGKNPCLICGKEIKPGSPYKTVHLLENGNIVSYGGDDVEGSQGFFPVGHNCAKRLVINFAF